MAWLIEAYLNEADNEMTRDDINGDDRFKDAKNKKKKSLGEKISNSPEAKSVEKQAKADGKDPEAANAVYTQKVLNTVKDKAKDYDDIYRKLTKKNKNYYPPDSTVKAIRRHNEK